MVSHEYLIQIIEEVVIHQKEHLLDEISRRKTMPKMIFGGGARLSELPNKALVDKIIKACEANIGIEEMILSLSRKYNSSVLTAISFADTFYNNKNLVSGNVMKWLVKRFQPSQFHLALFFNNKEVSPEFEEGLSRAAIREEAVYCDKEMYLGYDAINCDDDFSNVYMTLYEFICFRDLAFVDLIPNISDIGLEKYTKIGDFISGSAKGNDWLETTAAYFYLLGKDSDRAFALLHTGR